MTVRRCTPEEAGEALGALCGNPRTDTTGGLVDVAELLRGAQCFAVDAGGAAVGYYALSVVQHAGGPEVVIVAASGRLAGADLSAAILPLIDRQAQGARAITVHTCRPGLVARLKRFGYQIDGYLMRKALA